VKDGNGISRGKKEIRSNATGRNDIEEGDRPARSLPLNFFFFYFHPSTDADAERVHPTYRPILNSLGAAMPIRHAWQMAEEADAKTEEEEEDDEGKGSMKCVE
jgi:hypothetical protein